MTDPFLIEAAKKALESDAEPLEASNAKGQIESAIAARCEADSDYAAMLRLSEERLTETLRQAFDEASDSPEDLLAALYPKRTISKPERERIDDLRESWLAKKPPPREGTRPKTIKRWGVFAGIVHEYDPDMIEAVRKRAETFGLNLGQRTSIEVGFEYGKSRPAPRPASDAKSYKSVWEFTPELDRQTANEIRARIRGETTARNAGEPPAPVSTPDPIPEPPAPDDLPTDIPETAPTPDPLGSDHQTSESIQGKIILTADNEVNRIIEAIDRYGWNVRWDESRDALEAIGWIPPGLNAKQRQHARYKDGNRITLLELTHVKTMRTEIARRCQYIQTKQGYDHSMIEVVKPFEPTVARVDEVLHHVGMANSFNAIEDFIASIPDYDPKWGDMCWQLFKQFGVEYSPLNQWASRQIWTPAYFFNSRKGAPPCRPIIVLAGEQDIGKSTVIREMLPRDLQPYLHGPYFDPTASTKEQVEAVHGRLLVEIGELQRHSARTLGSFKNFSQSRDDSNVRLAYHRGTSPILRTAWFVGTANRIDTLPADDTEGQANTRLLPVWCNDGFNVEAWMNDVTDDSGITNRMKVWAHVKHECERSIRERGTIKMPSGLIEAHNERIDTNANVSDPLQVTVEWLTIEIDQAEARDAAIGRGYRMGDLLHSKTYIDKHLGGRSDFRNNEHKLGLQLAAALKKSGLWEYSKTNRRAPWTRNRTPVSQQAIDAKREHDERQDATDSKHGFGNAFGNDAPF